MIQSKLDQNEVIVVIIRKHWLIFVLHAVMLTAAALLPLLAFAFTPPSILESLSEVISGSAALFMYLLFALSLWILIFIDFTTYHLDVWIVTNRRVITINQKTLFFRDSTTLMLEKIQDATVEMRGLLSTLFNFGTLVIHTAGENPDITIHFAANPQKAKDLMLEAERAVNMRNQSRNVL